MDPLDQIGKNRVLLQHLTGYFEETLKEMIIERAYSGKEVKDITEARKVIERALIALEKKYEPSKTKISNDSK